MDADGSENINIKELIDFLEAVGGGDIDKQVVSQAVSSRYDGSFMCYVGVSGCNKWMWGLDLNTKHGLCLCLMIDVALKI